MRDDARMRIAVAGAHGQIALLLNRILADAGHAVVGLVRNPDHLGDVERSGAALLADAATLAHAGRYVLVSSLGVERVRGSDPTPDEDVFTTYLRAKLAAEDAIRSSELAWTVLRPGHLTDEPGTGAVRLAPEVDNGSVPRADVAAVAECTRS
jgi:uncharacterized protein YbjT (DUF2867 family)